MSPITLALIGATRADHLSLTVYDEAHSEFEERWHTIGHDAQGVLLLIAHSYHTTGSQSARIRLISARPATKQEQRLYADTPR